MLKFKATQTLTRGTITPTPSQCYIGVRFMYCREIDKQIGIGNFFRNKKELDCLTSEKNLLEFMATQTQTPKATPKHDLTQPVIAGLF